MRNEEEVGDEGREMEEPRGVAVPSETYSIGEGDWVCNMRMRGGDDVCGSRESSDHSDVPPQHPMFFHVFFVYFFVYLISEKKKTHI